MKAVRGLIVAAYAVALALEMPLALGEELRGHIVFARGTSLWLTDPHGKTPAVEIATLPGPAADVHMIRSDATGAVLLVDHGGRWYTAPVPDAGKVTALTERPCAEGPARLSPTGVHVLCANPAGRAQLVRLRDGKVFRRDAGIERGATITENPGRRELVSIADGAVIAAPLSDQRQRRVLAPLAPTRGLLASPDGRRAVGVFREAPAHARDAAERDYLMSFPLDGTGARRHLLPDAIAIDWSWDSTWLLVQAGTKACVTRGVGGQYKCWTGYTAVSMSPDGSYALVLGPRTAEAAPVDAPTTDESDDEPEGDEPDLADAAAPPRGPLSLYRARVAGAYTQAPVLVESVVDGAALWLPDRAAPVPPHP